MTFPQITLRQSDIDEMFRDEPVREVRLLIAHEDWEPFLAVAYDGMEIPVRVEGSEHALTAVLLGADPGTESILVVI